MYVFVYVRVGEWERGREGKKESAFIALITIDINSELLF